MDLFEALRKRRACRHFDERQVPEELLDKLVYAGLRAPTGGNIPYRKMVVITDPEVMKMIKLVSPGYFGDTSAAILLYTDLEVAEEGLGRLGRDVTSLYDVGAVAENIMLAAYALGLGACPIKSYSETAVQRILDLPETCRPELIVSVGYPADDAPPPSQTEEGREDRLAQ